MPASTVTTLSPSTTSTTAHVLDTGDVVGFETTEISLHGRSWRVAVADTTELRQQGLMFVQDLGDLDGMVFVFEAEREGSFWMKNTLIPLDIAFFDDSGELVGSLGMLPCEADPCPEYDIEAPYRFALEVPAGELDGLVTGDRIDF